MCLIYILAISLPTYCFGQENLIPNWSFEMLDQYFGDTLCPSGSFNIDMCEYWRSAHGSIDYFNACCNAENPNYGVPSNYFGSQVAFEGNAYAHFANYSNYFSNFSGSFREFIWVELFDTLKQGQGYLLRFRVSRADTAEYAVNKIGAFLSKENIQSSYEQDFFVFQPQVESSGAILADTGGWMVIEGQFIAAGGEKHLTIGSFHSNSNLIIQQLAPLPLTHLGYLGFASYYLDAIELYEDNSIGIFENQLGNLLAFPNPTSDYVNIEVYNRLINGTFTVFNQLGEMIDYGRIGSINSFTYRLPESKGIYSFQLLSPDGYIENLKIVRE
jgi:hypothetical protein